MINEHSITQKKKRINALHRLHFSVIAAEIVNDDGDTAFSKKMFFRLQGAVCA